MKDADVDVLVEVLGETLESLEISYCLSVTDKGIAAVAKGCPALTELNVSGTQGPSSVCSTSQLVRKNYPGPLGNWRSYLGPLGDWRS